MTIEIEHHEARIDDEDDLYHLSAYSLWEVWFRIVDQTVVEVVETVGSDEKTRSEYLPRAAEALVCNRPPNLVRDKDGTVIAKLVVNDIE